MIEPKQQIKTKKPTPFEAVLSLGGISGVVALMIAGAIAGRYFIHGPEQVPEILSHALTTILGFYFGAGVARAAAGQDA